MSTFEMLTIGVSVAIFVGGIAFSVLSLIVKYIFNKVSDHEKRLQSVEQVDGGKIDQLSVKVDLLEKSLDEVKVKLGELSANIHKEKNVENAMNGILNGILNHLEMSEKTHEKLLNYLQKAQ